MKYRIGAGSKLVVQARSGVHDTSTTWSAVTGEVEADPETFGETAATAVLTIDMTQFDAGDWLKNRKLRKDFDLDGHPRATFTLTSLPDIMPTADGPFRVTAHGVLAWRGHSVPLVVKGNGVLEPRRLRAVGTCELDIRQLGLAAPRFLLWKVEDVVMVAVTLEGTPA